SIGSPSTTRIIARAPASFSATAPSRRAMSTKGYGGCGDASRGAIKTRVLDSADLESHRASLTGHCYRMLGSAADAEDAAQEAIVRAWRSLDRFEGRASVRTWLHRIATNVCLDALADGSRKWRPMEEGPAGSIESHLETRERTHWLEPIPSGRAIPY